MVFSNLSWWRIAWTHHYTIDKRTVIIGYWAQDSCVLQIPTIKYLNESGEVIPASPGTIFQTQLAWMYIQALLM